jgi:WD40 repeat protein
MRGMKESQLSDRPMTQERRHYMLANIPSHLADARQGERLFALLTNYSFMLRKILVFGPQLLIEDYSSASRKDISFSPRREQALALVQEALLLSAHVIGDDPSQLAAQLIGRLLSTADENVRALVIQAQDWHDLTWLQPLSSSLAAPQGPMSRTLRWRGGRVTTIALSRDGRRATTGHEDGTIRSWDIAAGRLLYSLQAHKEGVWAVTFAADDERVLLGSADGTIRLIHFLTGHELLNFQDPTLSVSALTFTSDGQFVVAAGGVRDLLGPAGERLVQDLSSLDLLFLQTLLADTYSIRVWDVNSRRLVRKLTGHKDQVNALAITTTGEYLVSGSSDETLRVWDLRNSKGSRVLEGHAGPVWAVAPTPDGKQVVSASGDETLKVWDLDSGSEMLTIRGVSRHARSLAITPDGSSVIALDSTDRNFKIYNLANGSEIGALEGHPYHAPGLAISANGTTLVSAGWDRMVKVWHPERRASMGKNRHSDFVHAIKFAPDLRSVISGSADASIRIWNSVNGSQLYCLDTESEVSSLAITPDGHYIVSGSKMGAIDVWDCNIPRHAFTLGHHSETVWEIATSRDGRFVMSFSYQPEDRGGSIIRLWDLANRSQMRTWTRMMRSPRGVFLLPDRHWLISGTKDYSIEIWDLFSEAEPFLLKGHSSDIIAITITPDGRYAISGSDDRTCKLWDVDKRKPLFTLGNVPLWIRDVAITPDGRRAVTVATDLTVKLWNLESNELMATFTGESWMWSCAISPDGQSVVAGEQSGRMHFLRMECAVS